MLLIRNLKHSLQLVAFSGLASLATAQPHGGVGYARGPEQGAPPPRPSSALSLKPEELKFRKEEIRAAFELDEGDYAMELLNKLVDDLAVAGHQPKHPGAEPPPPPPPPPDQMHPPRFPGDEQESDPLGLRAEIRDIGFQHGEANRFLIRYKAEKRRLDLLKDKLRMGQIDSESMTLGDLMKREEALKARREAFLQQFRERSPKMIEKVHTLAGKLEGLSETDFPQAAELRARLVSFEKQFATLPASDDELFNQLLQFHEANSFSQRTRETDDQLDYQGGGIEPRAEQVEREIQLLQNRLKYLQREHEILTGEKLKSSRAEKMNDQLEEKKAIKKVDPSQNTERLQKPKAEESFKPLPRLPK